MIDPLIEWGKWARHDYGYYSSPMYRLMKRNNPKFNTGWRGDVPQISDNDALKVDKAVCELARHSVILANVLRLRYINDLSLRAISRYYLTPLEYPQQVGMGWQDKQRKKVCHKTVAKLLQQAERIVRQKI
ncbi:antiterminator Q family protein [Moraxella lincolnii]|uniref:Antitermination protein n=1 Tax=Lwoffella lincolnii TaxID=90241 RepID=A0A1T0CK73_9GAMM|nr:antiterminator Q family protein [Moraxella lincolnii]OOS22756.1 hypothetical protein B0682_00590 [Moraxella lincolnii]